MIISILEGIGLAFLIIFFASEMSSTMVVGWIVRKSKLDNFMEWNIHTYPLTGMSDKRSMFYGTPNLPFVSKSIGGFLTKWYISDCGRIPRWSKWSKQLDQMRLRYMEQHGPGPKKGIDKFIK